MAGLIRNQMPAQQEQQGAPDDEDLQDGGADEASEGEGPGGDMQQAYERIVMAASKVLHQPQIMREIINMVKAHPDPISGLADATIFVMKLLWQQSKGTMPQNLIVPAGKEVMEMIAQLCASAGLFKPTPDMLQKAQGLAAAKVLQSQGIDQGKAQQLAQQAGAAPSVKPAFQGG